MTLALSKTITFFSMVAFCAAAAANTENCDDLRAKYLSSPIYQNDLRQLQSLVELDNHCAKNILGTMYARGLNIQKDFLRAYSIFYDLAQRDYPPSQFNLAVVLASRDDHDPETLLNYLVGLTVKYMRSKDWGSIGTAARDYGRKYLDDRLKTSPNNKDLLKLSDEFEEKLRIGMKEIHAGFQAKIYEQKQFEDTVVSILAIGMIAHKAASLKSASSTPSFASPMPPALPRFYHLTPLGGNMVYAFPIY